MLVQIKVETMIGVHLIDVRAIILRRFPIRSLYETEKTGQTVKQHKCG